MEDGKSARMRCYRCTRCQLDVYRHSVHYDRRDRPICDPDCDGTKPGTCIWCEQVIVGRPMLMFDKKVHRECWQYCVAKFGYDAIVKRYSREDDLEKLCEKEVGEDMVREMVEEFFDKFCYEILSDEEDGSSGEHEIDLRRRDFRGKEGELEWGRAIRRVLRNKTHASLPDIPCGNERKTNEDANQWRGLSEGESVDCGSERSEEYIDEMALKEILSESLQDKAKALHRVHSAEEREEWLQAVQASLCGEAFFNRESWADTMFSSTLSHDQVSTGRGHSSSASNTTSSYDGHQSFVDRIIDDAVDVVRECNDEGIFKMVDGKRVIDYNEVWERATRKKNDTLMAGASLGVNEKGEYAHVKNARGQTSLLVDGIIDEAAADYLESSDEEFLGEIRRNMPLTQETDADDRVRNMFSKSWDEARAFQAMYQQVVDVKQCKSCVDNGFERVEIGERESSIALNDDYLDMCDDDGRPSETTVGSGNKSSKKKRRRKKQNDGDASAREQSGHDVKSNNRNDLVFESSIQNDDTDKERVNLLFDSNMLNETDSERSTGIANNGVEHILTEDQLDELFCQALVTSSDPVRLGRLINDFKNAVGDIQHNTFTCRDCPRSRVSSAVSDPRSDYSATEQFDIVINRLMQDITELNNSILIFRKYSRPEHLCDQSVDGDLLSTPQGEVYGTGNVLIIFDYGEERLESDPSSVFEYLANIYQEKESPRCCLHHRDENIHDLTSINNMNVDESIGSDSTDREKTFRHVVNPNASSRLTYPKTDSSFDNISTYEDMLWAKMMSDEPLSSSQESRRFVANVFGTDVEAQAWVAMLNAGKSEESLKEYASSVETFEDRHEKGTDVMEKQLNREPIESPSPKIEPGDQSCNPLRTNKFPKQERTSMENTNKQTDAMLLDRLCSIKRINFDESLTNMKSSGELHNSFVVRKSVSESDVSSYEMCAYTRYQSSEDISCCGAAETDEACTWNEVRQIVTEEAPTPIHHCVSLGAHNAPTDIYEIAIEITINKKAYDKGTNKTYVRDRRSTSSVDLTDFFKEWEERKKAILNESNSKNMNEQVVVGESQLEFTTQETGRNEDVCNKNMQPGVVNCKEDVPKDANESSGNVGAKTNEKLTEESSNNGLGSFGNSSKEVIDSSSSIEESPDDGRSGDTVLFERSIDDVGNLGTRSEMNTSWKVSSETLVTKASKGANQESSSNHDIDSKQSSDIYVSGKRSDEELNLAQKSEHGVQCNSSSELGIDVDLFYDDPMRYLPKLNKCHLVNVRKPDHSIFDCSSSDEDIFRTDLIEKKSKESRHQDNLHATSSNDKLLVCLKERDDNFGSKTSSGKALDEPHGGQGLHIEGRSSGQVSIDPESSNKVENYSYEQNIARRGSKHEDIKHQLESLSREKLELHKSGSRVIEVDMTSSKNNIESQHANQGNVKRENSREVTNSNMNDSGQTNVAEGEINNDRSKSCDMKSESVDLGRGVESVSSSQHVSHETSSKGETDDQHLGEGGIALEVSHTSEDDSNSLTEDNTCLQSTTEPEIFLKGSIRTYCNVTTSKEPDVVSETLEKEVNAIKSTPEEENVRSGSVILGNDASKEPDLVSETLGKEVNLLKSTPEEEYVRSGSVILGNDASKELDLVSETLVKELNLLKSTPEEEYVRSGLVILDNDASKEPDLVSETFVGEDIILTGTKEKEQLCPASTENDLTKSQVSDDIVESSVKSPLEQEIGLQDSSQSDNDESDVVCRTLATDDIFTKSAPEQEQDNPDSMHFDKYIATSQETDNVFDSCDKSLTKPVDSTRSICDYFDTSNKSENVEEIDWESLEEQEIANVDLSDKNGSLCVQRAGINKTVILRRSMSKNRSFNQRRPNHREEDGEVSGHLGILPKRSTIIGEFDLETYKGDSTEDEEEVCNVSEASEYEVDHEWPTENLSGCSMAKTGWYRDISVLPGWSSISAGDGVEHSAYMPDASLADQGTRSDDPLEGINRDCAVHEDLLVDDGDASSSIGVDADKKENKGKKDKKDKRNKKGKRGKKECKEDGGRRKGSPTCVIL